MKTVHSCLETLECSQFKSRIYKFKVVCQYGMTTLSWPQRGEEGDVSRPALYMMKRNV